MYVKLNKWSTFYTYTERLLKKYIYDNKQRFEVTVVPPNCAAMLLNLAHDQMGHNGSARTYMLLKRLYYWKGMKTDINVYVKQCKLCQKQNIVPVKYSQGHFSAPMVSGYHADTLITIKAEASRKADSRIH